MLPAYTVIDDFFSEAEALRQGSVPNAKVLSFGLAQQRAALPHLFLAKCAADLVRQRFGKV